MRVVANKQVHFVLLSDSFIMFSAKLKPSKSLQWSMNNQLTIHHIHLLLLAHCLLWSGFIRLVESLTYLGVNLGRFPFVRTDRPARSHRNENVTFNQN